MLFLTFCMTLKLLEYYELGEAGHLNSYYIRLSVHVVKIPPPPSLSFEKISVIRFLLIVFIKHEPQNLT